LSDGKGKVIESSEYSSDAHRDSTISEKAGFYPIGVVARNPVSETGKTSQSSGDVDSFFKT
jgi:hypothetical protein